MSHANAQLTPAGRLRLARLIVEENWPLRRAAERWNCSVTTAKRWADRYRMLGAAGMVDVDIVRGDPRTHEGVYLMGRVLVCGGNTSVSDQHMSRIQCGKGLSTLNLGTSYRHQIRGVSSSRTCVGKRPFLDMLRPAAVHPG